jgi:hypothetical protein
MLAIGSGPLPPRAPPEKKPPASASQNQPKPATPRPVVAPAVQEMTKSVSAVTPPVGVPTPPIKPSHSSSSLPKLCQPIPLSSRATLQPVGRGVAAAFTDHEDAWDESCDRSGTKGAELSNLRPPSPPMGARKGSMSPPLERSSGRERPGVYGKMPGDKDPLNDGASRDGQGGRIGGLSGLVHGDRGMPATSRNERGDSKGLSSREFEPSGRQQGISGGDKGRLLSGPGGQGPDKESGKSFSSRGGQPKDQYGRPKQEMARNTM